MKIRLFQVIWLFMIALPIIFGAIAFLLNMPKIGQGLILFLLCAAFSLPGFAICYIGIGSVRFPK
jgi:hypothetical protein